MTTAILPCQSGNSSKPQAWPACSSSSATSWANRSPTQQVRSPNPHPTHPNPNTHPSQPRLPLHPHRPRRPLLLPPSHLPRHHPRRRLPSPLDAPRLPLPPTPHIDRHRSPRLRHRLADRYGNLPVAQRTTAARPHDNVLGHWTSESGPTKRREHELCVRAVGDQRHHA